MSETNEQIDGVQALKNFLSTAGRLTLDDRKGIIEMSKIVLEEAYVHLPLKIAMHAVDPVRRLRIFQQHLEETSPDKIGQELDFHKEMLDIFTSLRDLHTNYILPEPFSSRYAILPFLVESYVMDSRQNEDGERRFIVTHVVTEYETASDRFKKILPPDFQLHLPSTFKPGVEITYWNGVPMQRAVDINANIKAGSNLVARFARGLEAMTIRPMRTSLPPDEEWVVIGYRTEEGQNLEYRQEWLVVSPKPTSVAIDANPVRSAYSYKIGMDLTTDLVREMKQILFAPSVVIDSQRHLAGSESLGHLIKKAEGLDSGIPDVFRAVKISEDIGYIRIYTFHKEYVDGIIDQLVEEFSRLIMQLPKNGLIIDVRGNGGGYINFAERLLQFLTPREIIPEPYSFISSPLTLEMARTTSDAELKSWQPSLSESFATGSIFSGGFTLTDKDEANRVGQRYHGPVILVTDALCYSATDLFAAGFQDHLIGPVLGVDNNTGAGGANVWKYEELRSVLAGSKYELREFPRLSPNEAFSPFRVSIRRNVRVGEHAGTPVEDLGIKPDIRYNMTRRDLLDGNADLIAKASEILAGMPVRQLEAVLSDQAGSLEIELNTLGISRADIYVDGRPVLSQDVSDGTNKLSIDKPSTSARQLKIIGLKGNEVAAARKVFL